MDAQQRQRHDNNSLAFGQWSQKSDIQICKKNNGLENLFFSLYMQCSLPVQICVCVCGGGGGADAEKRRKPVFFQWTSSLPASTSETFI